MEEKLKKLRRTKAVYDVISKTVASDGKLDTVKFITAGISDGISFALEVLGSKFDPDEFKSEDIEDDVRKILCDLAQKLPKDFEEL